MALGPFSATCSTPSSGGVTGLYIGNASDFTATIDPTSKIVTALTPTATQIMYAIDTLGTKFSNFAETTENDPEVGGSSSIPSLKFRIKVGSAADLFINEMVAAAQCGIVAIFKRGGTENNIVGYNKDYPLNIAKIGKTYNGELKAGSYYEIELTGEMPVEFNSRTFSGTIPD